MRKVRIKNRYAVIKRKQSDIPVQGNLAVTPAQMAKMAANGVAISSQIAGSFDDGSTDASFEVPLQQVRGLDIVDFWEAQNESRFNIKKHIKANESKYGDSTIKTS